MSRVVQGHMSSTIDTAASDTRALPRHTFSGSKGGVSRTHQTVSNNFHTTHGQPPKYLTAYRT